MAAPNNMLPTPYATITQADGYSTNAASEFWVRTAGGYLVYSGVPNYLAQNIRGMAYPDTAIAQQLAGYPRRVATS